MPEVERSDAIKVGEKWEQRSVGMKADKRVDFRRVVEIIARPTLSAPVGYRVLRNDAHPHRVGKTGSIRVVELRAKYARVAS